MSRCESGTKNYINRESELAKLEEHLQKASGGSGGFLLIEGEAGIGKTTLVNEFSGRKKEEINFMQSNCLYREENAPYAPFYDILSNVKGKEAGRSIVTSLDRPGGNMVQDENPTLAYQLLKELDEQDVQSLCFTMTFPEKLKKEYNFQNSNILWISETSEEGFHPKRLDFEALREIVNFFKEGDGVVFIDGFSYLVLENGFDKVLKFMKKISDLALMNNCTFIMHVNPNSIRLDQLAMLSQFLKPIEGQTQDGASIENLDKEQARLQESVLNHLMKNSSDRPLFFFMDDLQWADKSSIDLMMYLGRNVREHNIMFVGAYRPEDVSSRNNPLMDMLRYMTREKLFSRIRLKPFDREHTEMLVKSRFDNSQLTPDFFDMVHSHTDGNPFYIEELLQNLKEEGIIRKEDDIWKAGSVENVELPETVVDLIQRRLDRLDERAISVLRTAAVLGRRFHFDLLQEALGMPEVELLDVLEELERRRIINAVIHNEDQFEFDQVPMRSFIYSELSSPRKRLSHRKVAETIKKLRGEEGGVLYDLAHHYSHTRDYESLLKYNEAAGDMAKKDSAPADALEYYTKALYAVDRMDLDPYRHITLLRKQIDMYYILGDLEKCSESIEELIVLSEEVDDQCQKARAYQYMGDVQSVKNKWGEAQKNYEKSAELFRQSEDHRGVAESIMNLGKIHWRKGEGDRALTYLQAAMEALEKLEQEEHPILAAKIHFQMGNVYWGKDEWEQSLEHFQESLRIAKNQSDQYWVAKIYNNLGTTYHYMNDLEKAVEYFEKCAKISKDIGYLRYHGYGLANAAEEYASMKELDKAIEYADSALQIFKRLDEKTMIANLEIVYGMTSMEQGDNKEAEKHFLAAVDITKTIGHRDMLAQAHHHLGKLYAQTKDNKKAKEHLSLARDIYEQLGSAERLEKLEKELEEL